MLGVSVPPQLILGQSASLKCNYDLDGSKLYSVKWYKNGEEFYRYMPSMERQYDVFDVPGVNIDASIVDEDDNCFVTFFPACVQLLQNSSPILCQSCNRRNI